MEQYSIREAADLCGVKVRTIRDWIGRGKIHAEKQPNGWYWKIPKSEILRVNYERLEKKGLLDYGNED